ncbi:hypothetical protein B7463_g6332, partial [Scytalidium lignicola]
MATASEARAPPVTDNTSSFGQFRITKFVQSELQPHTAPINQEARRRATGADSRESTGNLDRESMFPTDRTPSYRQSEDGPSTTPSNIASQEQSLPGTSADGPPVAEVTEPAEVMESPSNLVLTRQLGPNRDGRVRNPVPSKLKGKTDTKKGNFGVMHMGLALSKKNESPARDTAAERGAAARRTSESTASRAKAAQQEKYVPPRKRATTAGTDEASPKVTNGASQFGRVGPADYHKPRGRALAPDEVKQEQARLLTLLRSITPLTVVDQLCKAVAYFGGIPSAPPPEDGIFPESANTRESGALFVGWLAEIFPNVVGVSEVSRVSEPARTPETIRKSVAPQLPEVSRASEVSGHAETPVLPQAFNANETPKVQEPPPKRGRGRPRKSAQPPPAPQEGSEISASTRSNGEQYHPTVIAPPPPIWDIPKAAASAVTQNSDSALEATTTGNINLELQKSVETQTQSIPVGINKQPQADAANVATVKKGRGRPRGSKNKNKGVVPENENTSMAPNPGAGAEQILQPSQPQPQPQMLQPTHSQISRPQHPQPQATMVESKSTNKSAQPLSNTTSPPDQSQTNYPKPLWDNESWSKRVTPVVDTSQIDDISAAERAVLETFRGQKSAQVFNSRVLNQAPTIATQATGVKRKRPSTSIPQLDDPSPLNTTVAERPQTAAVAAVNTTTIPQDVQTTLPQNQSTLQWNSSSSSTLAAQSAKRQRKPKAPGHNTSTSSQPTAHLNDMSPPTSQSMTPDSAGNSSSQQGVPVSRPLVEGLEAHYERFASHQQQTEQNRNRAPTTSQQQQQRPQHQMAASPPKHTPQQQVQRPAQQIQKQLQQARRQPQETQRLPQQTPQSDKHDGQIMSKSLSGRTPSNFFSNQGSSYNPQYPSNQPSQQYTTQQASPPMTSSSYGTPRTQSISGSTSQFSHSESVYRTNTPHTLPQTSPAFSQAESYKTNTSHSISNPSSSYPQVTNNYRITNMHNLPQQSTGVFTTRQPQTTVTTTHAQTTQQSTYNNAPYDPTYVDLPTLEQLGHGGVGGYGIGVGVGVSRAGNSNAGTFSTASSVHSISGFDPGTSNLLQAASRPGSNTGYRTSSGLGNNSFREHNGRS